MRCFPSLVTAVLILACTNILAATPADTATMQKAVLITGASSGIGRSAAERLAEAGYHVYAGARSPEDIAELNAIENIQAVRLDVTVQEDIDAAVKLVRDEGRGLWGVVNNAGVNFVEPLIETDVQELEYLFDVNVYGVFRVTKAFAPLVIESRGRIVNISSISGIISGGLTGYGMYSMSKHAVEAFTDALAYELGKLGVHVAAVEPGNFRSQIGYSRCRRMLAKNGEKEYDYFQEDMEFYLDSCRKRLAGETEPSAPPPDAVAAAIEHALFAEAPKEHYLVTPDPVETMITIRVAFEELLQLNNDHEHSYSREELIEMLDEEWAILRGEKERGWDEL